MNLPVESENLNNILADSNPEFFDGPKDFRQIDAIKRFINCKEQTLNNILLIHKVGTGKTITSLTLHISIIDLFAGNF